MNIDHESLICSFALQREDGLTDEVALVHPAFREAGRNLEHYRAVRPQLQSHEAAGNLRW